MIMDRTNHDEGIDAVAVAEKTAYGIVVPVNDVGDFEVVDTMRGGATKDMDDCIHTEVQKEDWMEDNCYWLQLRLVHSLEWSEEYGRSMVPGMDVVVVARMYQPLDFAPERNVIFFGLAWSPFVALIVPVRQPHLQVSERNTNNENIRMRSSFDAVERTVRLQSIRVYNNKLPFLHVVQIFV